MRTLNRQRASLVFSYMFENGKVLGPGQASARERIFDYDGALRWNGGPVIGRAKIGIPLLSLVKSLGPRHRTTGSISDTTISLDQLFEMFRSEEYILWYDEPHHDAFIVLKSGATPNSQLKAWAHALWLCHRITESKKTFQDKEMTLELLASTREDVCKTWDDNVALLRAAGWDLETASLETTSAVRVTLDAAAPAVQN